ncbi:MAG: selenide, water dikinase [Clostridia bacterium]|nr:selenide, water dikinase [Clostridia bacterium]
MGPGILNQVLHCLPRIQDDNLLVGMNTVDDAGVYQLSENMAIIQTVDFFTPIVDNPYLFGQIAAANALSDVYAMGGHPVTAMNIVAFPSKKLDITILSDILRGGADKVLEAGAVLVGGHSIEDNEPKYGLAVTGTVNPKKVITNSGAKPGDKLILTKPLGTGIICTAIKAEMATHDIEVEVSRLMATLNKEAAAAMIEIGVHSCTDITGFGLLGHGLEMAQGSHVNLIIYAKDVPVLPYSLEFASMGLIPGGAYRNQSYTEGEVNVNTGIDKSLTSVFYDPQTSGGLLIAVEEAKTEKLMLTLEKRGVTEASVIGEVIEGTGKIEVK